MVYTVTFNPSLDYIISVEGFQMGKTNRTAGEQMLPGGKGINVSTVLKNLGIPTTALDLPPDLQVKRSKEELRKRDWTVILSSLKQDIPGSM